MLSQRLLTSTTFLAPAGYAPGDSSGWRPGGPGGEMGEPAAAPLAGDASAGLRSPDEGGEAVSAAEVAPISVRSGVGLTGVAPEPATWSSGSAGEAGALTRRWRRTS